MRGSREQTGTRTLGPPLVPRGALKNERPPTVQSQSVGCGRQRLLSETLQGGKRDATRPCGSVLASSYRMTLFVHRRLGLVFSSPTYPSGGDRGVAMTTGIPRRRGPSRVI